MKNHYLTAIIGALFALFTSMDANAQIASMKDLYGKYELSFTSAAGTQTLDFEIKDSDNENYKKGMLEGFMGGESMNINQFDAEAHTFTVYNPTFDTAQGLYFANEAGKVPFAKDATDENFQMVVTFDPATKALTFPNMTLVTCDWKAWTADIKASYTSMTAKFVGEGEKEQVDWSGTWTVDSSNNYDYKTGAYSYPETFDFTIIEDGGKFYITEFLGNNIEAITNGGIELKADGNTATIAGGSIVGTMGESYLYLNAPYGGDIEFEMVAGNIKNTSWGFSISEGSASASPAFYYGCSTYKKSKGDDPTDVDRSGTYVCTGLEPMDMSEGLAPTSGNIVITKTSKGEYQITSFLGFDNPFTLDWGVMTYTPSEANKGTINCAILSWITAPEVAWGLADMNLTTAPVDVEFDESGNLFIPSFCIAQYTFDNAFAVVGNPELVAWYQNVTAVKADPTAISAVATNVNAPAEYFSLSGARLSAPQKGINIVRRGNVTSKILVK